MRLNCPHCGERPLDEFTFKGEVVQKRPKGDDPAAWHEYVYLRDNPRGRLEEYWHHSGGCRAWLIVTRDTQSHEIFAARPAGLEQARGKAAPKKAKVAS